MIAGHAAAGPLDGSLPADVAAALVAARAKSDALREDDPFRAEFHTVLAAAEAALRESPMAANGVDCRRGDFPTYFEPGQRASRARRACTARLHIRLQVVLACSAKGAQSLGRSAYPLRVARSPLPTAAATAGRAQGRVISTLLHVAELSSMALAGRPLAPSARRRGCAAAAGAVQRARRAPGRLGPVELGLDLRLCLRRWGARLAAACGVPKVQPVYSSVARMCMYSIRSIACVSSPQDAT